MNDDLTDEFNPRLLALVNEWAHANLRDVERIDKIAAYGTDWAGDTESGFYSRFEVSLIGRRRGAPESQPPYVWDVTGEKMESLWMHVVRSVDG